MGPLKKYLPGLRTTHHAPPARKKPSPLEGEGWAGGKATTCPAPQTERSSTLGKFVRCEQGVAFVEFALSISLLLLLFLGSVEISRCVLIIQKLEKTVSVAADVTTQTNPNTSPLTGSQMSQLMSAVTDMMSPYTAGASDPNILVIVSDVTQTGNASPVLNWQYCGGGALSATSSVGTTIGGTATPPNGFSMNSGEEIVIGEVFYNFSPIVAANTVISSFRIYRTAIFMPRLGALTGFSSHC